MHIFTIDLEEWFHINDSYLFNIKLWPALDKRVFIGTRLILDFLEQHDIKATFFVVGWIAQTYPGLVLEIAESGHQVGYHSYRHVRPFKQSREQYINDLLDGTRLIETLTGKKVLAYRAPNFSLGRNTEWVYRELIKNGFTVSSSIKQGSWLGRSKVQGSPFIVRSSEGQLIEFPLNQYCYTTFTGSGYFRICPKQLLKILYSQRDYTMNYFHPRDFDTQFNESLYLGYFRNWMHTVGNTTTIPKLEKLTTERKFTCIDDAVKQLDISKLEVIELR